MDRSSLPRQSGGAGGPELKQEFWGSPDLQTRRAPAGAGEYGIVVRLSPRYPWHAMTAQLVNVNCSDYRQPRRSQSLSSTPATRRGQRSAFWLLPKLIQARQSPGLVDEMEDIGAQSIGASESKNRLTASFFEQAPPAAQNHRKNE